MQPALKSGPPISSQKSEHHHVVNAVHHGKTATWSAACPCTVQVHEVRCTYVLRDIRWLQCDGTQKHMFDMLEHQDHLRHTSKEAHCTKQQQQPTPRSRSKAPLQQSINYPLSRNHPVVGLPG